MAVGGDPAAGGGPLGVYVHVPFCAHKCFYCDFTAYVQRPDRIASFMEALAAESAHVSRQPGVAGRRAATLYLGGGTPSVLSGPDMQRLIESVTAALPLAGPAEVTAEANPETLDAEKLAGYRSAGVNRISIGLQAWDDGLLRLLGRRHTVAGFLASFRQAREAGFANINVDLIFGLPGQTVAVWRETLDRVIGLGPEHVSAYGLQVEEGTAFWRWANEGRFGARGVPLPDEDAQAEMYLAAREMLSAAGYEHYEISNFARPGFRSTHNVLYWLNREYLGLGPAAHSHIGRRRWANAARLDRYRALTAAGLPPVEETEELTVEREMSDTIILGLRLLEGVDLASFAARFGRDLRDVYAAEVEDLLARGLLAFDLGRLRLTERALPVANRVFARFLDT